MSGFIVRRLFEQGSEVKAGDVLYQIDPAPFGVELQASEAALATATATFEQGPAAGPRVGGAVASASSRRPSTRLPSPGVQAKATWPPVKPTSRAPSSTSTTRRSARRSAAGSARALVTEGALVGQNDGDPLATIQQLDPVYADFTQSVGELHQLRRAFASGELERIAPDAANVRLVLDDGASMIMPAGCCSPRPRRSEHRPGDAARRVRNPKRSCCPACMSACRSSRASTTMRSRCRSRPSSATTTASSEVFVVTDDNRAALQPVRLGRVVGRPWMVVDGLKPGDQVVVDGFQKFVRRRHGQAACRGDRAQTADEARHRRRRSSQPRSSPLTRLPCRVSSSTGRSSPGSSRCSSA